MNKYLHHPVRICLILTLMAALLSLTSCKGDYEEFYFKGKVVGWSMCSSTLSGYLIEIEKPEGLGDTITVDGKFYRNAVWGYRPPRLLRKDETIIGVAYLYKDFGALNCIVLPLGELPEISIISVDEDPSVLDE